MHRRRPKNPARYWFTPTPVGNAPPRGRSHQSPTVHPHACGECSVDAVKPCPQVGSPPRLWGMRAAGLDKTRAAPVHPHACGECFPLNPPFSWEHGSPPRLWGMRYWRLAAAQRTRFTPTPVGNAASPACTVPPVTVHPHACGECRRFGDRVSLRGGSPPRLWGMRKQFSLNGPRRRFTPTPVGNAAPSRPSSHPASVHPHACGECNACHAVKVSRYGSPPRLWGMRHSASAVCQQQRFTPTPVGNAVDVPLVMSPRTVHPHACGECDRLACTERRAAGSPPRLWGMPQLRAPSPPMPRFTPTPVGNAGVAVNGFRCDRFTPTPVGNASAPPGFQRPSAGSPPRLWGMLLSQLRLQRL